MLYDFETILRKKIINRTDDMSILSEDNPVSNRIKDNIAMEPRFKENSHTQELTNVFMVDF